MIAALALGLMVMALSSNTAKAEVEVPLPGGSTPPKPPEPPDEPPVVSHHEAKIGRKTHAYTTTTGFLPIRNESGETEARLFFMAYTLDATESDPARPLMFSFNGGPGSSSVWLHLGGLGPRRVKMLDDGAMPPPPFEVVDNEFSWLEQTDLVFLDPVDTGYSRATTPELAKQFCGVTKDIESIGEFIRLYLTRYRRWTSPLFLVGESYGTFRAAGLAGHLVEQGIAFNGIVLVSSVLDLQTLRFHSGNDLPYVLYLPTYAATAWYHGRLSDDLQKRPLPELLAEVEEWALGDYASALARGSTLSPGERAGVVDRLVRYTGLAKRYVELSNLRLRIDRVCKELLRDDGRVVGRLDSRYTGHGPVAIGEGQDYDPSLSAIRPPHTATINQYLRTELGYESDRPYHILRGLEWDWGTSDDGYPQTSDALVDAFAKNPYLHVFVASGYYDLATPYFATEYTFNRLALDDDARAQLRTEEYPVGHMVYLERQTLAKLKSDVASFIATATSTAPRRLRG